MKQVDDKLWWKYIDNTCTQEERNHIEQLMAEEPSAMEEFLLRDALHQNLSKQVLEEPSFNFTAKVMDALPEPDYILYNEPIVNPLYSRIFLAIITLLLVSVVVLAFNLDDGNDTAGPIASYLQEGLSLFKGFLPTLPPVIAQAIIMTMISLGMLTAMDAFFKKRFMTARNR